MLRIQRSAADRESRRIRGSRGRTRSSLGYGARAGCHRDLASGHILRIARALQPIRERLTLFIHDAILENRFGHIGDTEELRHAVDEYIKDLRNEVLKFRTSAFGRAFRKWGPFSLGSIVSLGAAISGPWAFPLAGAGLLLMAVDKAGILERKATLRGDICSTRSSP
jgi:hypothetical protein